MWQGLNWISVSPIPTSSDRHILKRFSENILHNHVSAVKSLQLCLKYIFNAGIKCSMIDHKLLTSLLGREILILGL